MPTILGFDPGKKGGLAAIDLETGKVIEVMITPLTDDGLINGSIVGDFVTKHNPKLVYIENVHAMPSQGVCSMFNFGFSTGTLHGVCGALKIPVKTVSPQKWKKLVLGEDYAEGKSEGIDFCKKHCPEINLLPTKRSKKMHDGMSDAICIAYAGFLLEKAINTEKTTKG